MFFLIALVYSFSAAVYEQPVLASSGKRAGTSCQC